MPWVDRSARGLFRSEREIFLFTQILLNNLLSDIPGTTIASDNVDPEWVAKPRRWNTIFVSDYMVLFGLVSTLIIIIIGVTLVLPYVPFNFLLGFIPLPVPLMLTMLGLTALYVLVTEVARKYSRMTNALA